MATRYLVAAHYGAEQFGRLVEALSGNGRIVAHIDKKTDSWPFQEASGEGVEFVQDDDRVDVKWGGWSVVEATLAMMRQVTPYLSENDYVVLLSGDSYPLQPPDSIDRFFAQKPGVQYINHVPMPSIEASKPISRLSKLYVEYDPRNGRANIVPKLISRLGIPRAYKAGLSGRTPYAGSTWWALTGAACQWILDEIDRDRRFVAFCRRTQIPDEFFFQTLLCNSPYASSIAPAVMFADWSRPAGPKPAVFDGDHLTELAGQNLKIQQRGYGQSVALYGRKVVDEATVSGIREHLWPLVPAADSAIGSRAQA